MIDVVPVRDVPSGRESMGSGVEFARSLAGWEGEPYPSAVTIGMFDGVHLGHQALLRTLEDAAAAEGLRTAVITFDRHPRVAVAGAPGIGCITDLQEKRSLLEKLGIDFCGLIPVDAGILSMEAASFVKEFLVDRLGCRLIVSGYDFRFGHNRQGDVELLRSLAKQYNYRVIQAPVVLVDGIPVKSTGIRNRLLDGDMAGARMLLGRPFAVSGQVVEGRRLGRTLGFPTANVEPSPEKLLPLPGVYAGYCRTPDGGWPAAINLGTRPTVNGTALLLEAHLPGFTGELYGKTVTVEFGARLRSEQRFAGAAELQTQIGRDVEETQRWIEREAVNGWFESDDPSHVTLAESRQGG